MMKQQFPLSTFIVETVLIQEAGDIMYTTYREVLFFAGLCS